MHVDDALGKRGWPSFDFLREEKIFLSFFFSSFPPHPPQNGAPPPPPPSSTRRKRRRRRIRKHVDDLRPVTYRHGLKKKKKNYFGLKLLK